MNDHPNSRHAGNGDQPTPRPRWLDQCDAARTIRERIGLDKALGYLLGEKLMTFLSLADGNLAMQAEVPLFLGEVRRIFNAEELRGYFAVPRGIGPLAHVATAEELEMLRSAGAVEEDMDTALRDAIRFERMRRLLLEP